MKKTLIFTSLVIFLAGCGGGDSTSGSNSTYEGPMAFSEQYTMYPGDKVIKNSNPANLKVTHIDGHDESTIELVEGNATIIRKL